LQIFGNLQIYVVWQSVITMCFTPFGKLRASCGPRDTSSFSYRAGTCSRPASRATTRASSSR